MRSAERWVFLFLVGFCVFNWPFLTVFDGKLPSALFVLWGLFIGSTAFLAAREKRDRTR